MIREAEADWPAFSDQMETDARGSPFVRAREVFVANGIQPRESSDGGMEMAGLNRPACLQCSTKSVVDLDVSNH